MPPCHAEGVCICTGGSAGGGWQKPGWVGPQVCASQCFLQYLNNQALHIFNVSSCQYMPLTAHTVMTNQSHNCHQQWPGQGTRIELITNQNVEALVVVVRSSINELFHCSQRTSRQVLSRPPTAHPQHASSASCFVSWILHHCAAFHDVVPLSTVRSRGCCCSDLECVGF